MSVTTKEIAAWIAGTVVFSLTHCVNAASGDVAPYQFNGIVLDSAESELPKEYKAVFGKSDCRPDRMGETPVKRCARDFPPRALPGLPPGVKGPVHFYFQYVGGRLQQIGFTFGSDDYGAFISMLTKEHGVPRTSQPVIMDSVKATMHTWNRGRFSIATYPFYKGGTKTSGVFYSVIRDDYLLRQERLKKLSR